MVVCLVFQWTRFQVFILTCPANSSYLSLSEGDGWQFLVELHLFCKLVKVSSRVSSLRWWGEGKEREKHNLTRVPKLSRVDMYYSRYKLFGTTWCLSCIKCAYTAHSGEGNLQSWLSLPHSYIQHITESLFTCESTKMRGVVEEESLNTRESSAVCGSMNRWPRWLET